MPRPKKSLKSEREAKKKAKAARDNAARRLSHQIEREAKLAKAKEQELVSGSVKAAQKVAKGPVAGPIHAPHPAPAPVPKKKKYKSISSRTRLVMSVPTIARVTNAMWSTSLPNRTVKAKIYLTACLQFAVYEILRIAAKVRGIQETSKKTIRHNDITTALKPLHLEAKRIGSHDAEAEPKLMREVRRIWKEMRNVWDASKKEYRNPFGQVSRLSKAATVMVSQVLVSLLHGFAQMMPAILKRNSRARLIGPIRIRQALRAYRGKRGAISDRLKELMFNMADGALEKWAVEKPSAKGK